MVEIIRSSDCKNSPKNLFVQEFAIDGIIGADLTNRISPEADGFPQFPDLKAVRVHHAISHGKVGAANGAVSTATGEIAFALVLTFVNTKADRVASCTFYTKA